MSHELHPARSAGVISHGSQDLFLERSTSAWANKTMKLQTVMAKLFLVRGIGFSASPYRLGQPPNMPGTECWSRRQRRRVCERSQSLGPSLGPRLIYEGLMRHSWPLHVDATHSLTQKGTLHLPKFVEHAWNRGSRHWFAFIILIQLAQAVAPLTFIKFDSLSTFLKAKWPV